MNRSTLIASLPTWRTFFSIPSWIMLVLGIATPALLLITDQVYKLFFMEVPYDLKKGYASFIGIGLLMTFISPWFTKSPIIQRFLVSLSLILVYVVVLFLTVFIGFMIAGLPLTH